MWTRRKTLRALRTIFRFGKSHKRPLTVGATSTFAVVACRLAMPWPLGGVLLHVSRDGADDDASADVFGFLIPGFVDPVIWLVGCYFLLAVGSGVFEMVQRVSLKRFASYTVHDLRGEAVRGATRQLSRRGKGSGDIIARIIGDSARIKAGLSGILVHVFQNGLIFVGVSVVLLCFSLKLGGIFVIGGLAAIGVGLATSESVASTSRKMRRKEGKYAVRIQEHLEYGGSDADFEEDDELNESSARKDVKATRLIARSSLFSHIVLAAFIGFALWLGAGDVRSGALAPGVLFLFVAYALTVHRRTVQIGRQSARSGKVLACANRIARLLEAPADGADPNEDIEAPTLQSEVGLAGVRVYAGKDQLRTRLRKTTLAIPARARVALFGPIGAGKSTLLQLLAGRLTPDKGDVVWDGEAQDDENALELNTAYLAQEPVFSQAPAWKVVGLDDPDDVPKHAKRTLRRIGAWDLLRSFPNKLHQEVSSQRLSRNEARALVLGGILLKDDSPLLLLDSPLEGLPAELAEERLAEIFSRTKGRTVIVALPKLVCRDLFNRFVLIEGGRVEFLGKRKEWKAFKAARAEAEAEAVAEAEAEAESGDRVETSGGAADEARAEAEATTTE